MANSRLAFDEEELGSGGFCRVHRAWREDEDGNQVGEVLAIKFLKNEWLSDNDVLTRFQREVRLLQDELSHPNIIEVKGRNLSADPPWFTMPMMRTSLDKAIAVNEVATDTEIQHVFIQILEAMAYAHSRQIIHRDLKPHNVLLDVDSNVHVSDFGLGKDLAGDTGLTKSRMVAGTEAYMAPEQWDDMKSTGPPADVFALGKLLVHLANRTTPPVGAPDYAKVRDPYLYFIRRCCEPDPAQRYQDAGEALEAFRRLTSDPDDPDSQLLKLADRWLNTPDGPDLDVVREIHELFIRNRSEEELYTRRFPYLSEGVFEQYAEDLPEQFVEALRVFDGHVSGGLPFDYCDTVANFYNKIWDRLRRLDVLELVVTRLIVMGESHNRWYVRKEVSGILSKLKDGAQVQIAADVIIANGSASKWTAEEALTWKLPSTIREAFEGLP